MRSLILAFAFFIAGVDGKLILAIQPQGIAPIKEVSFKVLKTNREGTRRLSLTVLLDRKGSEEELRLLARKLRDAEPTKFERTVVSVFLPGMSTDIRSWATADFNPDLKVTIHGFTQAEEDAILSKPTDAARQVIGRWFEDGAPCVMTFYVEENKTFLQISFKKSVSKPDEMTERRIGDLRRFEKKSGSSLGEHFMLAKDGGMEVRDNDGLIYKLRACPASPSRP